MEDEFDFECSHCSCGYNQYEGHWSKQLKAYVCESCFDELNDQNGR